MSAYRSVSKTSSIYLPGGHTRSSFRLLRADIRSAVSTGLLTLLTLVLVLVLILPLLLPLVLILVLILIPALSIPTNLSTLASSGALFYKLLISISSSS